MVYITSNWGLQPAASSQHQTSIGEWKVFRWFQSSAFGSSGWGSVHNGAEKVISVVLCMNFWPTESVSNINDCFTQHCRGNLLCRHSNVKSTNISQFQMIQNELYWQILRWFGIIYSLVAQSVLAWKIPRDGGAWWATVCGVAQIRTRLKWLSSSSSSVGKESACGAGDWDSILVGKIPWRRKWQPTPVLLPGKSHEQRSLGSYSPWGLKCQIWQLNHHNQAHLLSELPLHLEKNESSWAALCWQSCCWVVSLLLMILVSFTY